MDTLSDTIVLFCILATLTAGFRAVALLWRREAAAGAAWCERMDGETTEE